MVRCLFPLCVVLFVGCASPPITPKNVTGIYHASAFFPIGEDLVLREDCSFTYTWFSDKADERNPTNYIDTEGRYKLRNNLIEFQSSISRPRQPPDEKRLPPLKTIRLRPRIIDFRWGEFAVWTAPEYEYFLRTHRKSDRVLIQERKFF